MEIQLYEIAGEDKDINEHIRDNPTSYVDTN